jgi:hypothetical protein
LISVGLSGYEFIEIASFVFMQPEWQGSATQLQSNGETLQSKCAI